MPDICSDGRKPALSDLRLSSVPVCFPFGYSESMSLFKDGEDGVIFLITAIVIIALSMLRVNTLNIILTLIQGIFAIYETMSAKANFPIMVLWFNMVLVSICF